MSLIRRLFHKPGRRTEAVRYVMMQGNNFIELGQVVLTEKVCSKCGKNANVVSATYLSLVQFIRSGGKGAYHHARLGTWGTCKIPHPSTLEAGYCEQCDKSFHLNCVEPVSLGGGTMFRCPVCGNDLAPFPV